MQKANHFKLNPTAKPLSNRPERRSMPTEQIASKMTSPTLVEFRHQNSNLPEWRLQLQNAVQQRLKSESKRPETGESPVAAVPAAMDAAGETAGAAPAARAESSNPYLSNALKRIESSRNRYYVPEPKPAVKKVEEKVPKKDYPFTIAARTETPAVNPEPEPENPTAVKPKLVRKKKARPIKDLYDTSELDPKFPPAKLSSSLGTASTPAAAKPAPEPEAKADAPAPAIETPTAPANVPDEAVEPDVEAYSVAAEAIADDLVFPVEEEAAVPARSTVDEYDDYASIGMRFNAGLFDFLIGSFLSFVLLLPFVVAGGNWFTVSGLLAFAATCAIVMFIYLTASVGLAGKSFGMHIFSLEMIDSGGENYPSLHQSAVSAAVYLISTACLGAGFITALFDDDRRAAHDLVSGTLVVREL